MLIESRRETYSFVCLRCSHRWSAVFDVRVAGDRSGNQWRMFFRNGTAAGSPEAGASCPGCGGFRVKLLPRSARPGTGTDDRDLWGSERAIRSSRRPVVRPSPPDRRVTTARVVPVAHAETPEPIVES